MTPTRLRECLAALHWSQRGLARILQWPEGTVRQWARGAAAIPADVAAWIEPLSRVHEANPPPVSRVLFVAVEDTSPSDFQAGRRSGLQSAADVCAAVMGTLYEDARKDPHGYEGGGLATVNHIRLKLIELCT